MQCGPTFQLSSDSASETVVCTVSGVAPGGRPTDPNKWPRIGGAVEALSNRSEVYDGIASGLRDVFHSTDGGDVLAESRRRPR